MFNVNFELHSKLDIPCYIYIQELVNKVKGYGGRFLSQNLDDGMWYEISHKGAKKKASQGKYELYYRYRNHLPVGSSNLLITHFSH